MRIYAPAFTRTRSFTQIHMVPVHWHSISCLRLVSHLMPTSLVFTSTDSFHVRHTHLHPPATCNYLSCLRSFVVMHKSGSEPWLELDFS